MYELMASLISIFGGILGYLAATGKIQISANEVKSEEWRNKFGSMLKITSPILIVFGIYRLASVCL